MNGFTNAPPGNTTAPYYSDGYWSNIDPALLQSSDQTLPSRPNQGEIDWSFLSGDAQQESWNFLVGDTLVQSPGISENTNDGLKPPTSNLDMPKWPTPLPIPQNQFFFDPPPYTAQSNPPPYTPQHNTRSQSKLQFSPPTNDPPSPERAPAPPPKIPNKYLPFTDPFGSSAAAASFLAQVQRKPFTDPSSDPSIAYIETHIPQTVAQIYAALVDQSQIKDNPAARVRSRFDGSASSYPARELIARSYGVLDALLRAVKVGWTDDASADVAIRSKFARDREAGCAERLANVCDALRREKQVALDAMNGDVVRLVHAPLEVAGSKARNRVSNAGKARALRTAKEMKRGRR